MGIYKTGIAITLHLHLGIGRDAACIRSDAVLLGGSRLNFKHDRVIAGIRHQEYFLGDLGQGA